MKINEARLQILINKLVSNAIHQEELAELNILLNQLNDSSLLNEELENIWRKVNSANELLSEDVYQNILSSKRFQAKPISNQTKTKRLITWPKLGYAAAVMVMLGIASVVYQGRKSSIKVLSENKVAKAEVATESIKGKVLLTLSDGRKIALEDLPKGELNVEKNANLFKADSGQLIYQNNVQVASNSAEVLYNTISTPVGVNYQMVLPDGTKVWLNAMSSIKFPVAFAPSHRNVELIGEGYFEVAKDKKRPFTVLANKMNVNVLGTHFNIKAYANDKLIKASLLEGAVKVGVANKEVVLKPGEQLLWNKELSKSEVRLFDGQDVMAWKNGYFIFRNMRVEEIMKEVSRWYNIDITYSKNLNNKTFGGKFLKSSSLTELLTSLELTGAVHFKVDGRRVTVMQ